MTELLSNSYVQIPLRATVTFLVAFGLQLPFLWVFIKVLSHIHSRLGPMYPGRMHGVGWPLAEGIKWIQKEDIIPARADRPIFKLAPVVALIPALMVFAVVPVAPGVVAAPLDLGVLYIVAISSVGAIALVMAAYASSSKFTLIGGLRAVGQIIAYELPVILAVLSVAMLAGELSLTGIVEAQRDGVWFIVWPFGLVAFAMFLTSSLAEAMWAPFDMPIAESEIIAGPYTEYSGMRFIFFQIAEFWHILALSAIGAVLFLGGWAGPPVIGGFLPPVVWMMVKFSALVFFFIWVRFTLPRLREDQLQKFAWKVLIPIGLANVLGIALVKVLL